MSEIHIDTSKPNAAVGRLPGPAERVLELMLCDYMRLMLKPGQLYRFTMDPECDRCVACNAPYEATP